jgi:hypothetical protein
MPSWTAPAPGRPAADRGLVGARRAGWTCQPSRSPGPVAGRLLVGDDDGTRSRLRVIDVAAGCAIELGREADVVRSGVLGRTSPRPGSTGLTVGPAPTSASGAVRRRRSAARALAGPPRTPVTGARSRPSCAGHPTEAGRELVRRGRLPDAGRGTRHRRHPAGRGTGPAIGLADAKSSPMRPARAPVPDPGRRPATGAGHARRRRRSRGAGRWS